MITVKIIVAHAYVHGSLIITTLPEPVPPANDPDNGKLLSMGERRLMLMIDCYQSQRVKN